MYIFFLYALISSILSAKYHTSYMSSRFNLHRRANWVYYCNCHSIFFSNKNTIASRKKRVNFSLVQIYDNFFNSQFKMDCWVPVWHLLWYCNQIAWPWSSISNELLWNGWVQLQLMLRIVGAAVTFSPSMHMYELFDRQ